MPIVNIPETNLPRVVIVGGGFAGLQLAKKLVNHSFQVVLFDKHNYHQFQPLLYQVSMSGLEPSSIAFPFRKAFQRKKNMHIRMAEVTGIDTENNYLNTNIGKCYFDKLIIATGCKTNFFGNVNIENNAFSLKSLSEAISLRNQILTDYERSILVRDFDERQEYLDVVIVGGGPTGVELAGSLAEMKKYILPKDYTEIDANEVDIYLVHNGERLLQGMSEKSSNEALKVLEGLGVKVMLNTKVTDFDGKTVSLNNGTQLKIRKVVWAAGIAASKIENFNGTTGGGGRYIVDACHRITGFNNIYAIGDVSLMTSETNPMGHPQVAQVAIQQARNLANMLIKDKLIPFEYNDKGTMATIGRNKAVVDLPKLHFKGFFAWLMWLVVHLTAILGVRNKVVVVLNWVWNYFTYDQSLRLIIKAKFHEQK